MEQRATRAFFLAVALAVAGCSSGPNVIESPSTLGGPDSTEAGSTLTSVSTEGETGLAPDPQGPKLGPGIDDLLPGTPVTTAPAGAVRATILERQEYTVTCLRDHGFDAEIQDDLGILVDFGDQQDRYFEVSALCREAMGQEFDISFGLESEDQLTRHFRAYLYVRECMIELGYVTDEPPSLEVFVESGGSAWHPYTAFVESGGLVTELEEICPQDLPYLESVLDLDG